MKYLLTILGLTLSMSAFSQVFPMELETSWEFKDETNEVIVIKYDLEDIEGLRYLKIVAKAFVDDRLIPMRSLRGDIGEAVKAGRKKTIEWNWENDVVEIAGELRFVVTADNPVSVDEVPEDDAELENPEIPVVKVLALPLAAGGGLVLTGLLSSSGAKSDWDALSASDRDQAQYDDLNGKYKTGQWLAIGGGVVIAAGIIWYIKEKAAMKAYSSRVTVHPHIEGLSFTAPSNTVPITNSSVGMSINFNF
jgi:hypothetical protein